MIRIPSVGDIEFDERLVPSGFCWSGECKSVESFRESNFFSLDTNGHHILICADSNSVAIGNYISAYYELDRRIAETASFLNDWMDYWCYLAWEYYVPSFADLPDWVQDAIKTVFGEAILFCDPWILLIDTDKSEGNEFPPSTQRKINEICLRAVFDEFENKLDEDEALADMRPESAPNWIMAAYEDFCARNTSEIMAYCSSEKSGCIGFGATIEGKIDKSKVDWVFEGLCDSLYENYDEFESAVIQAAEEGCKRLKAKPQEDLSSLSNEMIQNALGEINIAYEVNGNEADIDFDVDIEQMIYDYLAEYVEIEIKNRIRE